jgi:hypothetical protein
MPFFGRMTMVTYYDGSEDIRKKNAFFKIGSDS